MKPVCEMTKVVQLKGLLDWSRANGNGKSSAPRKAPYACGVPQAWRLKEYAGALDLMMPDVDPACRWLAHAWPFLIETSLFIATMLLVRAGIFGVR
jgi:hypothetical protein